MEHNDSSTQDFEICGRRLLAMHYYKSATRAPSIIISIAICVSYFFDESLSQYQGLQVVKIGGMYWLIVYR